LKGRDVAIEDSLKRKFIVKKQKFLNAATKGGLKRKLIAQ